MPLSHSFASVSFLSPPAPQKPPTDVDPNRVIQDASSKKENGLKTDPLTRKKSSTFVRAGKILKRRQLLWPPDHYPSGCIGFACIRVAAAAGL